MGTIGKPEIVFCTLLIVFLGFASSSKLHPQPYPASCSSNKDCLRGQAQCIQRECHCTDPTAIGDGKRYCTKGRPCPFGNLCKIASIVSPKYWHSSCVLINGPKSYCKCIKGYFGRAKVKGCFAPKDNFCIHHGNCLPHSQCNVRHRKCECKEGYAGNAKICKPGPTQTCTADKQCSSRAKCYKGKCLCLGKTIGNGKICRPSFRLCPKHMKAFCGKHPCVADPFVKSVYECKCKDGYEHDRHGRCIDIDECKVGKIVCSKERCTNTIGSYKCKPCKEGYMDDSNWYKCVDIDECKSGKANCSEARCTNTDGSYKCAPCLEGYAEDNKGYECVDIDECKSGKSECSEDRCTNIPASYECEPCQNGFEYGSDKKCVDIDECKTGNVTCPNDRCINTLGSYVCKFCDGGYTANSDGKCIDIDECKTGNASCSEDRCTNTPGSYECADCPKGFVEKSDGSCEAVPCNCGAHGHCNLGSSVCICDYGYQYSLQHSACVDMDECINSALCKADSEVCVNSEGSYECECKPGFLKKENGCIKATDLGKCKCVKHEQCFKGKCICKRGYMKSKNGKCVVIVKRSHEKMTSEGVATKVQSFYVFTDLCVLVTSLLGHLAFTA